MLRTFIQVTALFLTLESAIFLIKGNLGLSPTIIAELAATKWGHNLEVAKSLSTQRADTWIGVIFLLVAFGLQLANSLWPMRVMDFEVNKTGVAISILFCVILFVLALWVSKFLAARTINQVQGIIN